MKFEKVKERVEGKEPAEQLLHKAQFVRVSLASTKTGLMPHEIFTHSAPDTGLILMEAKSPVRPTALKALNECDTDKGQKENKHNKDTKGIISYIVSDLE